MDDNQEIPLRFKGYTDEEWSEIEDAARILQLDEASAKYFRECVEHCSTPLPGDVSGENPADHFLWSSERHRDECNEVEAAIVHLVGLLSHIRDGDGTSVKDRWEGLPLGDAFREARPSLSEMRSIAARMREEAEEDLAQTTALVRKSSNAKKHFRAHFLSSIAKYWEELGGTVSQGKEYEKFFVAVARPVFKSDFGQAYGLGLWVDATYPNRNEIFRSHARDWMRQTGRAGTRGPARLKKGK